MSSLPLKRKKMADPKKSKKYRRRKYADGSTVIYTSAGGAVCVVHNEEDAKTVLDALNTYENGKN